MLEVIECKGNYINLSNEGKIGTLELLVTNSPQLISDLVVHKFYC